MATAYEYSLSCGICLEFYDDPRILSCGHSFCFKCLQSLQNNRSFDVLIECPKCKAKSRSDRAYTKNFELRSLVQEFMEANKTQSDDRNMYCTDCDTLLSGEDISGHNRHNVVSLDEAITTFKVNAFPSCITIAFEHQWIIYSACASSSHISAARACE